MYTSFVLIDHYSLKKTWYLIFSLLVYFKKSKKLLTLNNRLAASIFRTKTKESSVALNALKPAWISAAVICDYACLMSSKRTKPFVGCLGYCCWWCVVKLIIILYNKAYVLQVFCITAYQKKVSQMVLTRNSHIFFMF